MIKQSKQDIYYSPSAIKTYLDKSINYAIFEIQNYCLDPISDFTRSRKLPANTLIRYIMNLSKIYLLESFVLKLLMKLMRLL